MWIGADAAISSAVTLTAVLVSARLIGPAAVGVASIVLVAAQTGNFLMGALFSDAIVQRKRLAAAQVHAALAVSIVLSLALAAGLSASAGFLARLYGAPEIEPLLRVASASIAFTGCSAVQAAVLRRHMRFRLLATSNMISRITASILCVVVAASGYGPWSLVLQFVASIAIDALIVIILSGASPRIPASLRPVRALLRFAVTETAAQFMTQIRSRLFLLLISYYLSLSAVGEINLAFRIVDSFSGIISSAVGRFCLVIFSRSQDQAEMLRLLFMQSTRLICSLTLPAFAALAICAPELMRVIFGREWLGAIPLLQGLSLLAIVLFSRGATTYLLTATARPWIPLLTNSLAAASMAICVVAFPPATSLQAVYYWIGPAVIVTVVDFAVVQVVFGFGIWSQLVALGPGLAAMVLMAAGLEAVRVLAALGGATATELLIFEMVAGSVLALPPLKVTLLVWHRARSEGNLGRAQVASVQV